MPTTKSKIAFVGVGFTHLTRTPERSEAAMGVEACRMAIEDAGLKPSDVDGISVQVHHWPPPDVPAIVEGIGMKQVNFEFGGNQRVGAGSIGPAAEALDRGDCRAIVIVKTMNTVAPIMTPEIDPETGEVAGQSQFEVPYGLGYTMQRTGFYARRYLERYSIKPEQIGSFVIVERENSIRHPYGFQKKPLTMEDYLTSRWIARPVRLLDADYPVNGAFAYVMTRADLAKTLRHKPVYVKGWSYGHSKASDHLLPELTEGISPIAQRLYRDTGLGPRDIDLAYTHDGFSYYSPMWLENLGLIPRGEGGNFIEGGDRIRPTGELPVNTHGGQISQGRMHGWGHVIEAVEQLRGTAGDRRVKKEANAAVITTAFPLTGYSAIVAND